VSIEDKRRPAEPSALPQNEEEPLDAEDEAIEIDLSAATSAGPLPQPVESRPGPPVLTPAPLNSQAEALKAQVARAEETARDLTDKAKDSHERMLRAAADLENFRKRALKEKDELQKFGIEKLLKDFLPILDNLERALEHAKSSGDFESLRQGVAITHKLFGDTLSRHGVKTFVSVGKAFDPRLHEALQQVETTDLPPNHVLSEIIKGYCLHDRLARPALVVVSRAPADVARDAVPPTEPAAPTAGPRPPQDVAPLGGPEVK
jgi:molecular chaperone GrpE